MSIQSNHTHRLALAETYLPDGVARAIGSILLVLAGTAIIAIAAKIKLPFWPVPITLQTLAIMTIAATYGTRLGVATVLVYLAEGALGIPVFTNTPPLAAGPAYFLGTTGGYLLGFVFIAWIVGWAADRGWSRSVPKMLGVMAVGEVVMMALGFVWLAWFATLSSGGIGLGASTAFTAGVAPFLLGDALKLLLVALGVPAIWALIGRKP